MPAFAFTMNTGVILFIVFQFINVIISTIKSILTVNGSRMTAAVINAVSYTFYAVVTKMLTEQPFEVVIPVTFLTNLIGVYVAKWILDKPEKKNCGSSCPPSNRKIRLMLKLCFAVKIWVTPYFRLRMTDSFSRFSPIRKNKARRSATFLENLTSNTPLWKINPIYERNPLTLPMKTDTILT